jgi:late competence protein required for DNA uptake (superfamily II DNA/RNA helicase)
VLISQVRIALHYILSDHFKNIPSDKLELIILKSLENIIDSDTPMFVFSNNITDTLDKILIIAIRKSFDIIYKSLNNIRKETYNLIVLKV